MESLGALLKEARNKKACSFEQVSRDTNIARRYLEALESEDFSAFPGEPYLLGFLRNYADYLGLDAPGMIDLYRNMKIQEEPVPVEALLRKPFPLKPLLTGIGIFAAVILVGFLSFFLVQGLSNPSSVSTETPEAASSHAVHALEAGYIEKRMYIGDRALVHFGPDEHSLIVKELGDTVAIESPVGILYIELGQEETIDLNADGHGDLIVFVADLYKNRPDRGASLRFELISTDATPIPASIAAPLIGEAATAAGGEAAAPVVSAVPATATAGSSSNAIFTSAGTAWPFTIQATFRGYCMFRWEIDRRDREERYFHKAETLTVQARNGVRLWISNAAAVKLTAIGGGRSVDLDIGRAGEVVVVDVKWVRDEDNQYRLITERVD